jgi:hypothetical protein
MKKCFYFFWIDMKRLFLLILILFSMSKATAQHPMNEQRNYFDDILLIINFNHPYYNNIEFLKEIYSPYFRNIVFYGEKKEPGVHAVAHHYGWFVHKAIRHAMKKWPNYKGYICCQDDCLMNFWNLTRLNKKKIWFHTFWTASLSCPQMDWVWWQYPCGHEASQEAYRKLPAKALKNLQANVGPGNFAFTWADFVYIPGKYRKDFIKISNCFSDPDVFIEIAIPTILLCLDRKEKMEKINPYWGGSINTINLADYRSDYDWVHPIKLSNLENRQFVRETIRQHAE